MLKERVDYKDFDGNDCAIDLYFNISRPELIDLQFSTEGGLRAHIERIALTKDVKELYNLVTEIVIKSYGERTPDGKSFIKKTPDGRYLGEMFLYHAAYEPFFLKLIENETNIANFINAVTPTLTDEERKESEKIVKEMQSKSTSDFTVVVSNK